MPTTLEPLADSCLDTPTPVTIDGSRRLITMGKSPAPLTPLAADVRDGQVVVSE